MSDDQPVRRGAEVAALDRVMKGRRLARPNSTRPRAAEVRDPKPAGDLIDQLVSREGWSFEVSLGSIAADWENIVGSDVARHCQPETFNEGQLTVRADSPPWATQIRLLSSSLLAALARTIGDGVITEVRVLGPAKPARPSRYITYQRRSSTS
ncbi:MAG: DciA family protein [Bifidobacteriaceae bacterium]|jgi:predicted nucleic acid-binding Zn ribbon protein|nr:DciA family protein [Bifidobacteriaceae bacterium]